MYEVWAPVVGSDGWYDVSDRGQVRSWYNGRWGRRKEPRMLTSAPNCISGYFDICLTLDGKIGTRAVHRLVSEAFIGPRPEGMETRHLNGVKTDNRLVNLTYGTRKENQSDKFSHGTQIRGEDHPQSKLSYLKAKAIRELYASEGFSYKDLGEVFNVNDRTIRKTISGEYWDEAHAPERVSI